MRQYHAIPKLRYQLNSESLLPITVLLVVALKSCCYIVTTLHAILNPHNGSILIKSITTMVQHTDKWSKPIFTIQELPIACKGTLFSDKNIFI